MIKEWFALKKLCEDYKLKKFVYDLLMTNLYFSSEVDKIANEKCSKVVKQYQMARLVAESCYLYFLKDEVLEENHKEEWTNTVKYYVESIESTKLDFVNFKIKANLVYYLFTVAVLLVGVVLLLKTTLNPKITGLICLFMGLYSIFKMIKGPYENALNYLCYRLIVATKEEL